MPTSFKKIQAVDELEVERDRSFRMKETFAMATMGALLKPEDLAKLSLKELEILRLNAWGALKNAENNYGLAPDDHKTIFDKRVNKDVKAHLRKVLTQLKKPVR